MCYPENVTASHRYGKEGKYGQPYKFYNRRYGWCSVSLHQQMVGW